MTNFDTALSGNKVRDAATTKLFVWRLSVEHTHMQGEHSGLLLKCFPNPSLSQEPEEGENGW